MMLILDTNVLIDLDNQNPKTLQKIRELRIRYPLPLRITFTSYFEFYHGLKDKTPSKLPRSVAFLEVFQTLLPTKRTAHLLSRLKHRYVNVAQSDLFIAAQTLEQDGVLITTDQDFRQIKELNTYFL